MATSTNYGWAEPDNSSLVKNGASDIRTLGNAIDVSLWNSGFGQAGKNKIINGNFGVWQRGTSLATYGYLADRFYLDTNGTITQSRQTFTAGTAPVAGYEGSYFLRGSKTGGTYFSIQQKIEDVRTFAGQTATLSFWAKVSSGTMTVTPTFEQNFGSGGSTTVYTYGSTVTLTTTWTRYSATVSIPSVSGKTIGTSSYLSAYPINVTSSTTLDYDIWGVQMEYGSVATPFQTATGTIQGELAACQRYYHRFTGGGSSDSLIGSGLGFSTTVAMFVWHLGTTMRIAPSSMDLSNQGIYRPTNATAYSGGTWSLNQAFDNSVRVIYTHGSAIFTAGESLIPSSTSATNFIGFSAEL